jgi:23S rRNA (guanosine2251-2'-O)-methyltransferase
MDIYGVHPVEELLKAAPGSVESVMVYRPDESNKRQVRRLARQFGVTFFEVDKDVLDRRADGENHQGVVAKTYEFEYARLGDLIDLGEGKTHAGVLVLDQIQDPYNLGAMIRTAAALDFDGVVIPKDRAASVTSAVVRTSAGCAFRIPIARVPNIGEALRQLKEAHFWAIGTPLDREQGGGTGQAEAVAPWELDLDRKVAVVLGGEHEGVRRLVAETCDLYTQIPMQTGIDSLNVNSAASILLYEVVRQWES